MSLADKLNIEAEINAVEKQLEMLYAKRNKLRRKLASIKYEELGLTPGRTVLLEQGRRDLRINPRRGVFVKLDDFGWAHVQLLKKDGKIGRTELVFYEWVIEGDRDERSIHQ